VAKTHTWTVSIGTPGKSRSYTITVTLDDRAAAKALEQHEQAPGRNRSSEESIVQALTTLKVKKAFSFW
jgi:hypothetical protein